jgi:Flp pilus assembly protein TadB
MEHENHTGTRHGWHIALCAIVIVGLVVVAVKVSSPALALFGMLCLAMLGVMLWVMRDAGHRH